MKEEEIKRLIEKFKIKNRVKPFYKISFIMSDNMRGNVEIAEDVWKTLHPVILLGLMYFGNGWDGKFAHEVEWSKYCTEYHPGDYYGHNWETNEHGLSELVPILEKEIGLMCYYSSGQKCSSYNMIIITYFDNTNREFPVELPSIDDYFATEEEMISTIKGEIENYYKQGSNKTTYGRAENYRL